MKKPQRKSFLVFGKPYIGHEEIAEVVDTLKSGWWGTGPKTEEFETAFAHYAKAKYALGVNSATAGLHLALIALGVGKGDEVITTPLTFVSTANVILHCGATPVFADVDRETWNIDPKEIEKKITSKTKVILPVHLHGRPCDMDAIMSIARRHKLFVVEDAAHAAEAVYKRKKIGSIGDITVFSFYVTKNIATGEGGMVTTNSKKFAESMRIMSLHGLSQDAYKRYSVRYYRHYEAVTPGYKYNLTDIASSIGIHQLARVEKNWVIRKQHWETYMHAFTSVPELMLPAAESPNTKHARHLFAILLRLEKLRISRDDFVDQLIKMNIGSGVHFSPVHLHEYYRKTFGFKKNMFPHAEFIGERTVSLPLGANLREKDIHDVIAAVSWLAGEWKK
ncbi:MAG: DegT/DnrJ/EryC1/StrS aminotransferase family protein [Candidatus Gottesmanbacteria bacterium]|nr:DegT/DnrJ/EryC1/StrS aminotransferase family protein [Candidatus Gottesmanbacteria bacterium]